MRIFSNTKPMILTVGFACLLAVQLPADAATQSVKTMADLAGDWQLNHKIQITVTKLGRKAFNGNSQCSFSVVNDLTGSFECFNKNATALHGNLTLLSKGKKMSLAFDSDAIHFFESDFKDALVEALLAGGDNVDPESIEMSSESITYTTFSVKNAHALANGAFTMAGKISGVVNGSLRKSTFSYKVVMSLKR